MDAPGRNRRRSSPPIQERRVESRRDEFRKAHAGETLHGRGHRHPGLALPGHPAAGQDVISHEALAQHPHLVLSSTGEDAGFIDTELDRNGLARRVALRAPLLTAANALAKSDLIAVVSDRTARALALLLPLDVLRLPFESPCVAAKLLWHKRQDDVPARAWP